MNNYPAWCTITLLLGKDKLALCLSPKFLCKK